MAEISITLPDGSTREVPAETTAAGLASDIGRRLADAAVIAEVNGAERDLDWALADGDQVAIVHDDDATRASTRSATRRRTCWHRRCSTCSPVPRSPSGRPIEDGFYYDFELPGPDGKPGTFSPTTSTRSRPTCARSSRRPSPSSATRSTTHEAREVFADHPYKLEIIDGEADDPTSVTEPGRVRTYENPPVSRRPTTVRGYPGFVDLCRGPHVPDTGRASATSS